MYIRWKKRQKAQGYALSAHLVKAVRIDGKPRQQVITHLCTLQSETMQQLDPLLWHLVEDRLASAEVDAATKECLCQAIAEKTPRATPEQITEAVRVHTQKTAELEARYPSPKNPPLPDIPPAIGPAIEPTGSYTVQWKHDSHPARYHVFLVKVTEQHGKRYQKRVTRLAFIDEQALRQQWEAAWREFWYRTHCTLCRTQVEPETYRDILAQLSQWIRFPESEDAFRHLLALEFGYATLHIDRELRDLSQRQQRLWKQNAVLRETREYGSRYL